VINFHFWVNPFKDKARSMFEVCSVTALRMFAPSKSACQSRRTRIMQAKKKKKKSSCLRWASGRIA